MAREVLNGGPRWNSPGRGKMADDITPPNQQTIELDDAAAYFGATTSSDMLHTMMSLPREQAMVQFFDLLSDIVLRPGDFDFEAASDRMQCEGGEIYYLVAGHLGLMSMPDPLLNALGLPNSSGEVLGEKLASITGDQELSLTKLADPMRMMKLFAVAHQTGKADEVLKYLSTFEASINSIETSLGVLVSINEELDAALDVSGHVLPIPSLASGSASAAELSLSTTPPIPEQTGKTVVPLPPSQVKPERSVNIEEVATASVPLPSESVKLPTVKVEVVPEQTINVENEKQVARATQNAFAGAFDIGLGGDEQPSDLETILLEEIPVPSGNIEAALPSLPEPEILKEIPEPEEEFISAAEQFIAADEDSSGALSVEELAHVTGASLEEATELHAEADTDGDGVVTLSEFISSPASDRSAGLPKPVAPVRKPLAASQQPKPNTQPVETQRPQPLPQQNWQQPPQQQRPPQQNWQQPPQQQRPPQQNWQQQPQQGWQQPQAPMVQPTIRSGVNCRNCGIGLDPYWRFCPVCGQQNTGY